MQPDAGRHSGAGNGRNPESIAINIQNGLGRKSEMIVNMDSRLGAFAPPRNDRAYSPIVRMTLLSGRVLLDDSLSSCASISSYFGTVVTAPFGTMCTTL